MKSVFSQDLAFHSVNKTDQNVKGIAVSGVIIDTVSKKPIPFASILLKTTSTSQKDKGILCDENGKFSLGVLKSINYQILISSVGYQTKNYPIDLSKETSQSKKITIELSQINNQLNEVKVVGSKAIIEESIDKLIYRAEKDFGSVNGTATDVLRKVPTITIDSDENIAVRGNSSVGILVDGKASFTSGGKPSEILKQIPAENIKRVEVMTSPSAKYDADGNTVVNIITKGKILEGINFNVNGGIGNRSSQGMMNFSYGKKKFTFFINSFGLDFRNKTDNLMSISEKQGLLSQPINNQFSTGFYNGIFLNNKVGVDFKITEKDFLTFTFDNFNRKINNKRFSEINYLIGNQIKIQQDLKSDIKILTNDFSIDFNHKFKEARHEFSTSFIRSRNDNLNLFETSLQNSELNLLKYSNQSYNQESVWQADYQNPISRKSFIETGLKTTFRRMYNKPSVLNPSELNYHQNVYASYFTYQVEPNRKWSIKSGLRYEYTDDKLETNQPVIKRNYHNLFPTIAVQLKLKKTSNTKLNYNYRVQRPSIFFVNPNQSINDPLSRMSGNINLKPEYTHNIEWILNNYINSASLNTTIFYRNIKNPISTYNSLQKGIILTNYINLDTQNDIGLSAYSSFKLVKKVQTTFSTNVYHSTLHYENQTKMGWMYSLGMMSSIDFKNAWSLQLYSGVNSPRIRLQSREPGYVIYNISAKKIYKKVTLNAGVDNLFTSKMPMRVLIETPNFNFENTTHLYNRGVRLTVNYRIGKLSTRANMIKDKKSGTDLKADEVK